MFIHVCFYMCACVCREPGLPLPYFSVPCPGNGTFVKIPDANYKLPFTRPMKLFRMCITYSVCRKVSLQNVWDLFNVLIEFVWTLSFGCNVSRVEVLCHNAHSIISAKQVVGAVIKISFVNLLERVRHRILLRSGETSFMQFTINIYGVRNFLY